MPGAPFGPRRRVFFGMLPSLALVLKGGQQKNGLKFTCRLYYIPAAGLSKLELRGCARNESEVFFIMALDPRSALHKPELPQSLQAPVSL